MPEPPDYLGNITYNQAEDALQYGVAGMRWGKRRTDAQLSADRAAAPKTEAVGGAETSSTRYARLRAQAKGGGASQMSDVDLKFMNARTEALAKVSKMNQTNPSWLSTTSKKVLQSVAEQQMKQIADAMANKYVGDPIIDNIKKKATDSASAAAAASAAAKVASTSKKN